MQRIWIIHKFEVDSLGIMNLSLVSFASIIMTPYMWISGRLLVLLNSEDRWDLVILCIGKVKQGND